MRKIPELTVDIDIPVPDNRGVYPLDKLEVGQSFSFPIEKRNSVQSGATRYKVETGKEFTVRKQSATTCRVWRTK